MAAAAATMQHTVTTKTLSYPHFHAGESCSMSGMPVQLKLQPMLKSRPSSRSWACSMARYPHASAVCAYPQETIWKVHPSAPCLCVAHICVTTTQLLPSLLVAYASFGTSHMHYAQGGSPAHIENGTAMLQVYTDVKQLRYGHLMIMTDQDHDGSHIKGLIMNYFHSFYPSLMQLPGFLIEFITPVIKVLSAKLLHPLMQPAWHAHWSCLF